MQQRTYPEDDQIEGRIVAYLAGVNVDRVDLRKRVGRAGDAPYLPVNLPLDVHYVEKHLDARQFGGQGQGRQVQDVSHRQGRTDLVGHVEGGLLENNSLEWIR